MPKVCAKSVYRPLPPRKNFQNSHHKLTTNKLKLIPYNDKMTDKYPDHWRKANPKRPNALQSRITEQQKADLYSREISTRELAKVLNVHEKHLSYVFPGKEPITNKRLLIEARKEFKISVAKEILQGTLTIQGAANKCYVSYHTMLRYLQKAKNRFPELVTTYEKVITEQRKLNLSYARKAKNV